MTTPGDPADPFRAETVLFDLDGTLTDSAPGIRAGFRHALAHIGEPEPTAEMLSTVIGPPLLDSFLSFGLNETRAARAVDCYRARYDERGWAENSVFEGMDEVLSRLSDTGVTMAVATSKTELTAHRILEHFGLSKYFAFIAGSEGSRQSKSDVIARALAETSTTPVAADLGGTPGVAMVGDRIHDVEGAALWGIPTVFVEWGYGPPSETLCARWTASSAPELGALLTALTDGT
ncbi:phosphoglycolate phosphatase [Rhodococcus sp. AW25M09]|nr:phosphoglycolate phosphatase [Rhodococcus sp. AW25M09]